MPYTTGQMTSTRATGVAVSTLVVNVANEAGEPATVTIMLFVTNDYGTKIPVSSNTYTVATETTSVFQYSIGGNYGWEIQYSNTDNTPDLAVSVFGLDEYGNLVPTQVVLPTQFLSIGALS